MSGPIRRQPHGIKAVSITITLPGAELAELRAEAKARGITPSRLIVELIRLARAVRATMPAREEVA